MLRELRADQYAALQTQASLLIEALLLVAQNTPLLSEDGCITFNQAASKSCLLQRIAALLSEPVSMNLSVWKLWGALLLPLIPFLALYCHFYAAFCETYLFSETYDDGDSSLSPMVAAASQLD